MTWTALYGLLPVLTLGLLTPGPDFLLILHSASRSARAGYATAAGIAAGLAVQMALLLAGFAAVQEYPQVMLAIRVCGAVFLILTGVRMLIAWRRPTATGNGSLSLRDAALPGFSQGFLCNITNAKAFLFFIALIGSTVPADAPPFERLVVGLIVVLHGWACWSAIVRMLQLAPVRTRLLAIQGGLTGLCGGLLVVLGALSLIPS